MSRKLGLCLAFMATVLAARSARALNSGRIVGAGVSGAFYRYSVYQNPSETWTFSTSNLSSGGDTVIHVQNQDDLQAGYVAGNDDYSGVASLVTVPAVGSGRNLLVIVRSYSSASQGTCDLTATSSLFGSTVISSVPFGGTTFYGSPKHVVGVDLAS